MTKFRTNEKGLIVPESPVPVKDERKYGRLELKDKEARKNLALAINRLLNSCDVRYGSLVAASIGDIDRMKARKEYILQFAFTMLGDDFGYEELC